MVSLKKENGIYHKNLYCSDFHKCSDGEEIFELFLLSEVQYHSNDRETKWLNLKLEDRTGGLKAKVWSENIKMEYEGYEGQVVFVKGKVTFYAGHPDLYVENMRLAKAEEFVLTEVTRGISPEMEQGCRSYIKRLLSKINDASLVTFCSAIMNEEMMDRMARLPVHMLGHHAYRGGLLEHTCDVATGAYYLAWSTTSMRMEPVDLDLVIAGALLHDIGSTRMIEPAGYGFRVKSIKRMQGAAYAAHAILTENAVKYPLDEKTLSMLLHIVDSSHASGESPAFMEAMTVRTANQYSIDVGFYSDAFRDYDQIYGGKAECIWSRERQMDIYRMKRGGESC